MVQILFIIFCLSLDSLVISFAYGANNYKINFFKTCLISSISSLILLGAVFLGNTFQSFFSQQASVWLYFIILVSLGLIQLIKSSLKLYLNGKPEKCQKFSFNFLEVDFKMYLTLPEKDSFEDIPLAFNLKEALFLGITLSLDNMVAGIGLGIMGIFGFHIFFMALFINLGLFSLGNLLGYKLSKRLDFDLGWLCGIILILLALTKLS